MGRVPLPGQVLVRGREKVGSEKEAVTVGAALIVAVKVPVPVKPPPLQPVKAEPAAGVAVSMTAVPLLNEEAQVAPQEMPAGALVTGPPPAPVLVMVGAKHRTVKGAGSDGASLIVTVREPGDREPPLQ